LSAPFAAILMLDPGAFDSLWYWLFVVLFWGQATARVLGVPVAVIDRAAAGDADAAAEGAPMLARECARRGADAAHPRPWQGAVMGFGLALLAVLGFGYGLEIAQAAVLILGPAALGTLREAALMRDIASLGDGAPPWPLMRAHRLRMRALAILSVAAAALWVSVSVLAMES
jgi:hypothetical protein